MASHIVIELSEKLFKLMNQLPELLGSTLRAHNVIHMHQDA